MVKAKPVSKPNGKSRNDLNPQANKRIRHTKKQDASIPCCVECGDIINEDAKALQCERCIDDVWKCASCLGLNDDLYEQLAMGGKCNLHWFCDKCEQLIVNPSLVENMHSLFESKMDYVEKLLMQALTGLEQKMIHRMSQVEDMLQNKADNDLLVSVDGRLKKMEERPVIMEESQNRIEHKVDQLCTTHYEPVAIAVQGALQQDKAEEMEIEKRKKNIIVHGVPESESTSPEQRIEDDLSLLSVMFHEADVENVTVDNVIRLGKKASDATTNPRPMKVVLNTVDNKLTLLRNAKNLRMREEGGWSKVFIHQDLTPKQREARKPLVAELKERKAKGEKDLIIFNGKVVKRRGAIPRQEN